MAVNTLMLGVCGISGNQMKVTFVLVQFSNLSCDSAVLILWLSLGKKKSLG